MFVEFSVSCFNLLVESAVSGNMYYETLAQIIHAESKHVYWFVGCHVLSFYLWSSWKMLSSTPCGYVSSPAKSLIVCIPLSSPFAFYVPWRLGPHFSFKDACFWCSVYSYKAKSCYTLIVTYFVHNLLKSCFQNMILVKLWNLAYKHAIVPLTSFAFHLCPWLFDFVYFFSRVCNEWNDNVRFIWLKLLTRMFWPKKKKILNRMVKKNWMVKWNRLVHSMRLAESENYSRELK